MPELLRLSCVSEALPVKFPVSCQRFSWLALVSWWLSKTHAPVNETRYPRVAFCSCERFTAEFVFLFLLLFLVQV